MVKLSTFRGKKESYCSSFVENGARGTCTVLCVQLGCIHVCVRLPNKTSFNLRREKHLKKNDP